MKYLDYIHKFNMIFFYANLLLVRLFDHGGDVVSTTNSDKTAWKGHISISSRYNRQSTTKNYGHLMAFTGVVIPYWLQGVNTPPAFLSWSYLPHGRKPDSWAKVPEPPDRPGSQATTNNSLKMGFIRKPSTPGRPDHIAIREANWQRNINAKLVVFVQS